MTYQYHSFLTEEARARNAARVAELFPGIIKRVPEVKE